MGEWECKPCSPHLFEKVEREKMELFEIMRRRKSVRQYQEDAISQEKIEAILEAALLAPTSRGLNETDFIVVREPSMLEKLSQVKKAGGGMLKKAACAIVVCGDSVRGDTWIEDSSIAMTYMHIKATELGLGSCWVQIRLRKDEEGGEAGENVRGLLKIPDHYQVEAILSLGEIEEVLPERPVPSLQTERIHEGSF